MRLIYLGTDTRTDWIAGWPAADHEDADAKRVEEKVRSGLYRVEKAEAEGEPAPTTKAPRRQRVKE